MRLIDADKLKAHLEKSEFTTKNKSVERGGNEMLHYFMPKIIDDEPTFKREGCCICGADKKMFKLECSNTKQTLYICGSCAKDIAEQHFSEKSMNDEYKSVKHGRWIPTEYDSYADGAPVWNKWECSECGYEHSGEEDTLTHFCGNCGAEMGGDNNEINSRGG